MKKHKLLFLSLILVVGILPTYAEGTDWQSIQQIKQSTPNAWQQVYETPWRTISIEAKVIVPNVDAVPILRVSYLTPRPEEKLSRYDRVCHNNDRCFYGIVGSNPQDQKDQPYADVPLLSFAQAKGAMEEKIRSGYIREIERVELCYAPYNDPTDDSILWLLPVWRAHCVIDENPEHTAKIGTNKHGEILDERIWSDVVFEAQRGALMNPLDASKKRRNVPTMMTWDDAKRY
ncbi:MAG: hypothetical protein RSC91_04380 [Clostridia bacterium]